MTPKEQLKEIYNGMSNNIGFVKEFKNIEQALTELEELKRYPTSEEVCEAMSEYYGVEVIYRKTDGFQVFRSRWNDGEYGDIYLEELIKTPHLITLLGRFYEGLGK